MSFCICIYIQISYFVLTSSYKNKLIIDLLLLITYDWFSSLLKIILINILILC